MAVRFRDDVVASFRLLTGADRWVPIDLLAGIAGYVVWVAGSAALGLQLASLAEYEVTPGGTPTVLVLAAAGLFWLVLPAGLAVARVCSRLLNLRGNVEQEYRLDRPAALLVPPAVLIVLVGAVGILLGRIEPTLAALAPLTLYLLVRTTAYSYRVFSFSHPLALYGSLFLTLLAQAGILLLYLGETTENGAVLAATVSALGFPVDPLKAAEVAGFTAPIGLAVAVVLPLVLVLAYLTLQTIAAIAVRVQQPTVRPSRVRTGQRYPSWLDVAASSAGSDGRNAPSPSGAAATPGNADATDRESTTTADASQSTGGTGSQDSPSTSAATDADDAEESTEADAVNHTRVFTPPDGADDALSTPDADSAESNCPNCGATIPANADRCPACGRETN